VISMILVPSRKTNTTARPGFEKDVIELANFIRKKQSLVVITGAGISTESGIPDYRGPNGSYKQGHKPVTYQEFLAKKQSRQRYWARSMSAWPLFASAQPSLPHLTIAQLEHLGFVDNIITQNVDRLHHKAGSRKVLELHGTLSETFCLGCKTKSLQTTRATSIRNGTKKSIVEGFLLSNSRTIDQTRW